MISVKRSNSVWRVLTMPIGPRIVPRLPGFSGVVYPARVIESSGLPGDVAGLVRGVVARTRLWRGEQVDVARELCAHFADGLASGRGAAELIAGFGDAGAAARLIRRAKKRGRPLWWRAWAQVRCTACVMLAAVVVVYAALTVRYMTGSPTIARNYGAEVAASLAKVPEQDRAWPLYREAGELLGPHSSEESRSRWGVIAPGDPDWPEVEGFLSRVSAAMELTRRGAARPALGLDMVKPGAASGNDPRPLWGEIEFNYSGTLWRLAWVLREDAMGAAARGDADRAVNDLTAIIRIAGHSAESPFSMTGSAALYVLNSAMATTNQILAAYPAAIPEAKLVELAHRLASFGGGGTLRIDVRGDRMAFLDMVQRSYTDDGHGDGRIIRDGWRQLAGYGGWPILTSTNLRRAVEPVAMVAAPRRREVIDARDRAQAAADAAGSRPMYEWTVDPDERAREVLEAAAPYVPSVSAFLTGMGGLYHYCEVQTQRRDATLVAIGLELYRRAHGVYPEGLEQLTPSYLPAVPIDRFDGKPIKYVLRGGRPLIYSVGGDRTDNGGTLKDGRFGNSRVMEWVPPGKSVELRPNRRPAAGVGSDWILWPPIKYDENGEVIAPGTP